MRVGMSPIPLYEGADLTPAARAEGGSSNQATLLSAILDTVGALVIVFQRDGRIARFNRACELLAGAGAEGIIGRRVNDLFPPGEDLMRFERQLAEVAATGQAGECETSWSTRTRARRILWSISALRRPAGDVEYLVAAGTDITDRLRLQRTILEIADREQHRIGRDLHDGLGQHLTGIAFMSKVLEDKLSANGQSEAEDARRIVGLVNDAIAKTRELARGLLPTKAACEGLGPALREVARDSQVLFGIACWTATGVPLSLADDSVTHLCYIAREAVNNAVRHGRARHIRIEVVNDGDTARLSIRDDGIGFPPTPSTEGLGLNLMRYRSSMIGGSLDIARGHPSGTVITCRFPLGDAQSPEAFV